MKDLITKLFENATDTMRSSIFILCGTRLMGDFVAKLKNLLKVSVE